MTRRAQFARTAELQKTLVYCDGPQVVLFRTDRDFPMLAVAIDDEAYEYGFFASETKDDVLARYLEERVDLAYVFNQGAKRHYLFDAGDIEGNVAKLTRATAEQTSSRDYYPEAGFFARYHTAEIAVPRLVPDTIHAYKIDGSWDAGDFSRFYAKVADLYAIFAITSQAIREKLGAQDLAFIKHSIASYGWQGGGSYVGFYDNIFAHIHKLNPLKVRRIAYASPGQIELKGGDEPLSDIDGLITAFGENAEALKASYKAVDKIISRDGLRRYEGDRTFSSEANHDFARDNSFSIMRSLGVDPPESLLELCGGDMVVFSKVALSFYRRARDLYAFHAEGRVTAAGEVGDY